MTIRRLAGIAGLAYVFGVAIENMEILEAPTRSSSIADVRAAYADHAFAVVTSVAGVLALLAYLVFVVALCVWLPERPREPWATIALAGGIGGPVLAAAGLAGNATIVASSGTSDDVVGALHDFYLTARIVSGIFVALFLGGIGLAALRSRALPRPLPEMALAVAIPMAFAPLAAFDQAPGLDLAVSIAFAGQTLWVFLASMWLTLAGDISRPVFVRRAAFLLLVVAAGATGLALLAAPAASGKFFAWGLGPEPLAAFAGGVYIGSAAAYALALRHAAGQVRGFVAGALLLSSSVLVVTLAHLDQFDFDRLQAWAWVVLFAGFSLVTAALLPFEREQGGARPERPPRWARGVLLAVAIPAAALAIALWLDPTGLAGPSPFELSPLGGRFTGSWVALLACLCGWAVVRNRVDQARLSGAALTALPAGALAGAIRSVGHLHPPGAAALYIATLALLVVLGVVVLAGLSARRPSG